MRQIRTKLFKSLSPIFILVIMFLGGTAQGRRPLANDGERGRYVKSIEQVLRLEPEEVDIATAALIVSEHWSEMVRGLWYLSVLDDMAYEIRRRLRAEKIPTDYRAIPVINEYLFEDLEFESVKDANDPNDLFLHSVMDKKRGYCLSLSVLYLSLAERLGLPLYGVVVPGHFFVRYDDGNKRFNIETTSKGGTASDEQYKKEFEVPIVYGDSIYLKNLNKIQTLGCFLNNLGNAYEEIGNYELAMKALEGAVDINPALAESRTNLGNVYLKLGRVEEAIEQYREAIDINPGVAPTYNNLGTAYMKAGRLRDAVRQLKRCIELDPNFVDGYKNLASAYSRQNHFEWALLKLNKALALKPDDDSIYKQFGDIKKQMGLYQEAVSYYQKALELNSHSAQSFFGLAVCYNKMALKQREIEAYKQALAIEPHMFAALANLGNAYFADENYDSAIQKYTKALELKPDDDGLLYNLGAAYFNKGEYQKAARWYTSSLEVDPGAGETYHALAAVYYKLGSYEIAHENAQKAEELGTPVSKDLIAAIKANLP